MTLRATVEAFGALGVYATLVVCTLYATDLHHDGRSELASYFRSAGISRTFSTASISVPPLSLYRQ